MWSAEAPSVVTEPSGMAGPQDTFGLERRIALAGYKGRALRKGFLALRGPFPIAGSASWSNDWHAYRPCPTPHVHQGLDIFAARGTPVVAVGAAVVTSKRAGAVSGLAVKITDAAGVQYFYGHLDRFAAGLRPGQQVRAGQILGYVGNSGNAVGGATHVHFEILLGGLPTPPKPYVDRWLLAAQVKASRLHRGSKGPVSVPPPAHRDAYAAAFGGPMVMLGLATTSLRGEPEDSLGPLWAIGGGILLAFVLLGFLRAGPRRRETPAFSASTTRSSELLEAMCAQPGPQPAVVPRGSTATTWAILDEPLRLEATGSAGQSGVHVRTPNPSRSGVATGLMVIVAVTATTWSWIK